MNKVVWREGKFRIVKTDTNIYVPEFKGWFFWTPDIRAIWFYSKDVAMDYIKQRQQNESVRH